MCVYLCMYLLIVNVHRSHIIIYCDTSEFIWKLVRLSFTDWRILKKTNWFLFEIRRDKWTTNEEFFCEHLTVCGMANHRARSSNAGQSHDASEWRRPITGSVLVTRPITGRVLVTPTNHRARFNIADQSHDVLYNVTHSWPMKWLHSFRMRNRTYKSGCVGASERWWRSHCSGRSLVVKHW